MNQPKAGTPGHYANQVFRRRFLSNGTVRGCENYHAAIDGLPGWLGERFPKLRNVVGVYENVSGSPSDALVFCDDRICLLNTEADRVAKEIVYHEILDWAWFSKDPIAKQLTVKMINGEKVDLPIYGAEGAVASLATFLGGASHRSRKREQDRQG